MTELEALHLVDASAHRENSYWGYSYSQLVLYVEGRGQPPATAQEAWSLASKVTRKLEAIWTNSGESLAQTAMNNCVNCRRHVREHAKNGKCLFDHTHFEAFIDISKENP